jgi:hypothetical protein
MAEPRNHSNKIMHKIKKRKKDQKKNYEGEKPILNVG